MYNTNKIIKKFKKIHNDKYDYSLIEYKGIYTKVKIICKEHGVFDQTPKTHLKGSGCYKCGLIKISQSKTKTTKQFIKESKKLHGNKYDYSLVKYIKNDIPVKIICKKHGIFNQIPITHLNSSECPNCSKIIRIQKITKTTEQFIKDAKKIHGNKYDYSLVKYTNKSNKVKIICKKHGIFEQEANSHLRGHGCSTCNDSKGEQNIKKYLKNNNLIYKEQQTFKGCKDKKLLRFDFFLLDYNLCVEYDGKQHFQPIDYYGGSKEFKQTQKRDNIKNNYCKENNIYLLRIKYTNLNNIETILNKEIKNKIII